VAEDYLYYRNNGVDYIPFDCQGKPIYFEIDKDARKILSENPENKNQVLIPLKKGSHAIRIQSISRSKSSIFGGILKIPTASHHLTISRSTVKLGLPSGIIPLWFSGGQGIKSPVKWWDILCLFLALILAFLFFEGKKARTAGFISLAGFYFIFPAVYFIILISAVLTAAGRLVWRFLKGWQRWVGLGTATAVVAIVIIVSSTLYMDRSKDQYLYFRHGEQPSAPTSTMEVGTGKRKAGFDKDNEPGQRNIPNQQVQPEDKKLGDLYFSGENVVKGVKPVALPMPQFERQLTVTRELVTRDRPLSPTLIYVTPTALYPLLIFWICCLVYIGIVLRPLLKPLMEKGKDIWKQK
jgi:hypothetical protein